MVALRLQRERAGWIQSRGEKKKNENKFHFISFFFFSSGRLVVLIVHNFIARSVSVQFETVHTTRAAAAPRMWRFQ